MKEEPNKIMVIGTKKDHSSIIKDIIEEEELSFINPNSYKYRSYHNNHKNYNKNDSFNVPDFLKNIDIIKEYKLIKEKKSNLSSKERQYIINLLKS